MVEELGSSSGKRRTKVETGEQQVVHWATLHGTWRDVHIRTENHWLEKRAVGGVENMWVPRRVCIHIHMYICKSTIHICIYMLIDRHDGFLFPNFWGCFLCRQVFEGEYSFWIFQNEFFTGILDHFNKRRFGFSIILRHCRVISSCCFGWFKVNYGIDKLSGCLMSREYVHCLLLQPKT